jgi:hypothetical protein
MIQAKLETRNFFFSAYGQTTSHAKNALIRGLVHHGKQYGLDDDWLDDYLESIYFVYIKLNCAYRDNELIGGKE